MTVSVKILKEGVKGADDGATVRPYAKGKEYEVSEALALVFIEAGEAEEVKKPTATDKVKAKAEKAAAEAAAKAAEKEAAEKAAAEAEAATNAPAAPTGLPLPKAPGK